MIRRVMKTPIIGLKIKKTHSAAVKVVSFSFISSINMSVTSMNAKPVIAISHIKRL